MSRTPIDIAKDAQKLEEGSKLVVSEEEWALLNEVASDPDRKERCISVHDVPLYIDKGEGEVVRAPAGIVFGVNLEYTGE